MNILFILIIAMLDQITKYIAKNTLAGKNISVFKDYLELTYVENRGAAFGLFQNMKFLLIVITAIVIVLMLYYLLKSKDLNKWMRISLILISAGAIGNLIDRVTLGYVTDFIHFYIKDMFDWPVFNVADICVVCGTILLAINILFAREE
ncbi:signal peptidase II [Fonticella tunisiensis]|uniref:Lipoprotein signal peptidase n=1 Tax=Fonticella tunisiensis TaxID=1096341 RepID=A0A4V3ETH7_9CLOT|nr:signal peptidase II [Fonticella tunisiensis]TDT61829.1 signal peptidase II [Fonticella tunisiensis]